MNSTARKVGALPTIEYAAEMVSPLASVAADVGALGIRPCYLLVSVNEYHELVHGRPWEVSVQVDTVDEVDRVADHYGLGQDNGTRGNYTRSGVASVNGRDVEVQVYAGRPKDRRALIREWVAENYSDESKRRVAEGIEATPEDRAKFAAAEASGLFTEATR